MTVRIVLLGDVVGMPGVRAVVQQVPEIRRRYAPHLIIANAENAANGTGLTPALYRRLCDAGVDAITLGDHTFKKSQIVSVLEREANIIRPANLSVQAAGRAWMRLRVPGDGSGDDVDVYVFTVLGRLFMQLPANDPFATADAILAQLPDPAPLALVEVHAEATSEKVAMGWHLNGRVAAVFGTHTHVPTADARVLPAGVPGPDAAGGTAYVTDLGMCGPADSVLGRRADRVLKHMTTAMHAPFDVAEGNPQVHGVLIELDPATRRATRIESLHLTADTSRPPFAEG